MNPPSMSRAFVLDLGRSRIWPTEARTTKPSPRYLEMVLDFDGLSTMTSFIARKYYTHLVWSANLGDFLLRAGHADDSIGRNAHGGDTEQQERNHAGNFD